MMKCEYHRYHFGRQRSSFRICSVIFGSYLVFKTNLKIVITVGFNNQSGVEHVTLYIIIVISMEMCGSSESTHFIGNNNNNLLKVNKKLFLRKTSKFLLFLKIIYQQNV